MRGKPLNLFRRGVQLGTRKTKNAKGLGRGPVVLAEAYYARAQRADEALESLRRGMFLAWMVWTLANMECQGHRFGESSSGERNCD